MDNIKDDDLTNLSWLKKYFILCRLVECSNSHIDDDLQCLCWIIKIRPTSYSLKRLSVTTNKVKHYRNSNRLLSYPNVFDHSLNTVTNAMIDTENSDTNSTSQRILMLRTLNNHLCPMKTDQQSFILMHSSNGKISYLSIRHFV
ncbi:unnamed protein product [Rotaria sp. Silwood2]|nr:unnamed protein product [Rotaria sp. Silwood2]CAF2868906.1 unnamed protein product [Rotaria sp. Silwood2]CAF3122137.1 unnamed protein product [Rotaria sp. Silwood2]CAF3259003.1 unnamed protein product [Rotaria sp. Silwood2]CAF3990792.1 unnamed protein product [Rotaria sp. Silwood2]